MHLQQGDTAEAAKLARFARTSPDIDNQGWEALLLQAIAVASGDAEEKDKKQAMQDAQRAVCLRPWETRAWTGLEYVRGGEQ